jgi:hypothetical protein
MSDDHAPMVVSSPVDDDAELSLYATHVPFIVACKHRPYASQSFAAAWPHRRYGRWRLIVALRANHRRAAPP